MMNAFNLRQARRNTGGDDDVVKTLRFHFLAGNEGIQLQGAAGQLHAAAEVADGFVELFLARHLDGKSSNT